jgi:4-hydroxy-3-polyprenylbenzoate decarboxylase
MAHRSLADFVEELGRSGELVRVEAEVDPSGEATEIAARVARSRGPALLFASLRGHQIPLLVNLLGTEERILRALDAQSLAEAAGRVRALCQSEAESGNPWPRFAPRRVKAAACQQIVRPGSDVDLGQFPLPQIAADDGRPTVAAATVLTAGPDSHRPVAGRYPIVPLDRSRAAIGWASHDPHARLLAEYRVRGEKMPLAAVIGGDPAVLLAAGAQLPRYLEPLTLAGALRNKPLDAADGRTVDLMIPAESDVVLEGYVDPVQPMADVGRQIGPLGHICRPRPLPVMQVTAITQRANPVFWDITCGDMASEIALIDATLTRICLPLFQQSLSDVNDIELSSAAGGRFEAVVAIRKTYTGQARQVAAAAWGLQRLLFAKLLVLVDESVDVRDTTEIQRAMACHVDPARDVFFQQGPPDPWDAAVAADGLGTRMAIDATVKLPGEHGDTPVQAAGPDATLRQQVSDRWPEYGLGPEP